jgi:hypothetical protein
MLRKDREEIDAAKVEALVVVLKDALPELVAVAFAKFKAELPRILPGLTDDEWTEIRGDEDQRRREVRRLAWIENPAPLHSPVHWWDEHSDCKRYEAEIGDGNPPYCIRARMIRGTTFFIVSRSTKHYTIKRSLAEAEAFAGAHAAKTAGKDK